MSHAPLHTLNSTVEHNRQRSAVAIRPYNQPCRVPDERAEAEVRATSDQGNDSRQPQVTLL